MSNTTLLPPSPRIVLVGSVETSLRTLTALVREGARVVGVLGLEPKDASKISGFVRLDLFAREHNIPYYTFQNINDSHTVDIIRRLHPDLLFVVGLSQLVKQQILELASVACIGFHPTNLPEARGRAPVPWMILEHRSGAATFFQLESGTDSGPILCQEPFSVELNDYARDVHDKIDMAIDTALTKWVPQLLAGKWLPLPQAEENASYRGRRCPEDGCIDWNSSAEDISTLIRATSHPYPGAYSFVAESKLIIWRADIDYSNTQKGVIGRILDLKDGHPLVQTGSFPIRLTEFELANKIQSEFKVGMRLGLEYEDQIRQLRTQIDTLEEKVSELYSLLGNKNVANK